MLGERENREFTGGEFEDCPGRVPRRYKQGRRLNKCEFLKRSRFNPRLPVSGLRNRTRGKIEIDVISTFALGKI